MTRILEDWLTEYMAYTEHTEAPDKFHFWAGVSTIAGALRRRVWINMGYFTWTPNFFIFFVAPPGIVNKSTTGQIGTDLLRELGYINFGPSAGTWQALIKKMAECGEEFPLPNGDCMPMTAVTVVLSELGTFLDPNNREQIDVLVDLWDGKQGVWRKSTKSDGDEDVVNPWVNLLGFTTPAWVAENFTSYFSGGGFMSRSLFVYSDRKRRLVAYPFEHLPPDFLTRRQRLIHDLDEIAKLCGPFELGKEAIAWGKDWYKKHKEAAHEHLNRERFGGYLARKQTHIHKVAMVMSASERQDMIITARDLARANDKVTELEADMPHMFGQVGREKEVVLAAEVLSYIRNNGEMPRAQVYRNFMRTVGWETFEKVLKSLSQGGLISLQVRETVMFVVPIKPSSKQEVETNDAL